MQHLFIIVVHITVESQFLFAILRETHDQLFPLYPPDVPGSQRSCLPIKVPLRS